jgi:hypothetical protein
MGQIGDIHVGRLAVTVTYADGMEIQLLPAVEQGDYTAISSPTGNDWTRIDPKEFSSRLTSLNEQQGRAVVPAIKIAKAILTANLPEDRRPTGYHVEALAIAAFSEYDGPRTPRAMVQRFFDSATSDVLRPVPDVTGQSRFVDGDLGEENSASRRAVSRSLLEITRRMQRTTSVADWRSLLGE